LHKKDVQITISLSLFTALGLLGSHSHEEKSLGACTGVCGAASYCNCNLMSGFEINAALDYLHRRGDARKPNSDLLFLRSSVH